ncbi:putative bifunctional diguanylate cyclase/phosphodiesterase [Arsenicicoccus cauae]|uniref:putative bifunctional diguanylate cyclase/phosphodiesterase n=1 Tax=Arsenicicoccus cauae TaxID=2663847 RepID=UPI00370D0F8B
MHSRTAVAAALGVPLVLLPSVASLTRPELGAPLLWTSALVSAAVAAVAAVRSRGLDRAGWLLLAGAMALNLVANLLQVTVGQGLGLTPSVLYAVATCLILQSVECFAADSALRLVTTMIHATLLTACLWTAVWHFDPQRWLSGFALGTGVESVLVVIGLVGGISAAVISWLLVVPAHGGRARGIQVLVGLSVLSSTVGDLLTYLLPGGAAWAVSQCLWIAQCGLLTWAALLVSRRPAAPLARTLHDPHRDLFVVSGLSLLVGAALMLSVGSLGIEAGTVRALCFILFLLVALHLHEGHHSRQLASSVQEQERHMRLLVSETRDIIIELDRTGRVVFASQALSTILGLRESDLAGQHISDVLPDVSPEVLAHLTYAPNARMQSTLRLESALTTTSAAVVHVESVITPLARGYLVAVRDVSERVGLQSRLQHVTYHDVVTGLPNRTSLDRAVRHRLYESATGEISLLLIDLATAGPADNTVGDDAREELLRTVARTMRATIRTGDSLARFSDQRFAVLLRQDTDAAQALAEAHRVVDAINRPDLIPDITLRTCGGLCIGGHTGLELVRNAELALRQASREGPGTVRTFEPTMLAQFARTRDLRRRLARPPGPDRWTVLYQPIVNLRAEQVTGVEALLRWTDPEGDFIGIEEVIRLAEEFGSILAIGTWVLEQAVDQALQWFRLGHPLTVAVNISVHQLVAPGFASTVHRVLDESGLPPELLILEITETVVLEQSEETVATLKELRTLGIRVAIDDFGTGYSGLANLRSLPLDILKIDRTFVQGLGATSGDEAVVAAVSRLGRELGLTITAEGIETRAQESRARMLGITAAQGYLYARPLPAGQILPLAEQIAGGAVLDL